LRTTLLTCTARRYATAISKAYPNRAALDASPSPYKKRGWASPDSVASSAAEESDSVVFRRERARPLRRKLATAAAVVRPEERSAERTCWGRLVDGAGHVYYRNDTTGREQSSRPAVGTRDEAEDSEQEVQEIVLSD
jgi:hypothetical protein